jgi:hypothetical protein
VEVEVQKFAYWTLVVDIHMYRCLVGEHRVSSYFHVLVQWPDNGPSSVPKLVAK